MATYKIEDLAFRILAKTKTLDKATVKLVLEKFGKAMTDIMIENSAVKIEGWGKYTPITRKSRKMRPRGGEPILVPAVKTVVFKPEKKVKEALNTREDSDIKYVIETSSPQSSESGHSEESD